MNELRRVDDTSMGRIIYFWPLILGIGAFLVSLGGYVATIHYFGDHISNIETWVTGERDIVARLTTLQEVTNRRLDDLEDWRNGVNGIYGNKHHHGESD